MNLLCISVRTYQENKNGEILINGAYVFNHCTTTGLDRGTFVLLVN